MIELFCVALGGALGAVLRFVLSRAILSISSPDFPWGTLCANLLGCFTIGFLYEYFEVKTIAPELRAFIFIGILGGFTTFSSYGLETLNLMRKGNALAALGNILVSNILGILFVMAGVLVVREIIFG